MKITKITILLLALISSISFISCVEDGDFTIPKSLGNEQEPILTGTQVSFSSVKNRFLQAGDVATFDASENIYIVGYVISNDSNGNFFKELIIQNTTENNGTDENPRTGLKVNIDVTGLSNKYNFGRKVYLKLGGLTVSEDSGVVTIGQLDANNEFTNISSFEIDNFLFRSLETFEITPKTTSFTALEENDLNTLLAFEDVQVSSTALGKTFAGEESDEFDGERLIESCIDGGSILLSTSTFSDFQSQVLPSGSGSLTAIYGKNFFGDKEVLVLNNPENISFTKNRCDISTSLTLTITLKEVRSLYQGSNILFVPGKNEIAEGYVISSDRKGNFFRKIYIQDEIENPTAGIQILTFDTNLFEAYPIGSKVIIKLDKLYLGPDEDDVLTIGQIDNDEVDRIDSGLIGQFLFNTGVKENIVPTPAIINGDKVITIDALDENGNPIDENNDGITDRINALESTLIKLENMQMPKSTIGQAYAFYGGTDSADRLIENCDTGSSIALRNSGFADFSSTQFPTGKGSVTAIFSKPDAEPTLFIRTTDDLDLTIERCDPEFLECVGEINATTAIYSENFETFTGLIQEGWSTINVGNNSANVWTKSFSGFSDFLQITGDNVSNTQEEIWLISPTINLDNTSEEQLFFDIQTGFNNGTILSVYLSIDYTNDPITASWQQLDISIPEGLTGGFGSSVTIDPVNISCVNGDIKIGFLYKPSAPYATTSYRIDNIEIKGKSN